MRQQFGLPAPRATRERRRRWGPGSSSTSSGIILTNNHVVAGADEVMVKLADNRQLPRPRAWAAIPPTDVAVVKLDKPPADLQAVTLGDSDQVRVGDYVLAIGNPLGLGPDGDDGHRERQEPRARREAGRRRPALRGLHPDRRRHQPGQLGRPAVQLPRRGHRHQLGDHQPGRGDERRLRHPDQPRAPGRGADPQGGAGRARLPRRERRGLHRRARRRDAPAVHAGRAGQRGDRARRRPRRACASNDVVVELAGQPSTASGACRRSWRCCARARRPSSSTCGRGGGSRRR